MHRSVDSRSEQVFGRLYFERSRSGSIFGGKKPLQNRFWIRYLRRLKRSGRLLDLGCGEGFFLEDAERYYEAEGTDISDYAIGKAMARCKTAKLCVRDAKHLDFPSKRFDIIVSFDMMEHIDRPLLAIRECNRIMKKGGILLMSVPNIHSIGRSWKKSNWFGYRDKTHVSLLSRDMWIQLLQEGGFETMQVIYDGLWDSPYLSIIPQIIQHAIFKLPSTLLLYFGFPFPEKVGENMYLVSYKRKDL